MVLVSIESVTAQELEFAFKVKAKTKIVVKSFEPNSIRCLSSDNKSEDAGAVDHLQVDLTRRAARRRAR